MKKSALLLLSFVLAGPVFPGGSLHAQERPKERDTRERIDADRAKENTDERLTGKDDKVGDEKTGPKDDRVTPKDDRPGMDGARESSEEKAKTSEELRAERADRLRENREAGKSWEGTTERTIAAREGVEPFREVTLESANGTRSRADMIYRDHNGKYVLIECKASDTADFTGNQREVFGSIRNGDQVTVRGDGMGEAGNGQRITISEVYVSRPDADGNVRLEPYQDKRSSNPGSRGDAGKSP